MIDIQSIITTNTYSNIGWVAAFEAFYGQGNGPILLDDVKCSGTEERLIDCPHNGFNNHNCRHTEDVGVSCERKEPPMPVLICYESNMLRNKASANNC